MTNKNVRGAKLTFRVATLYYLKHPFSKKKLIHLNKQDSVAHTGQKKKPLIKTAPEEAQVLDLLDKDFISAILNVQRTKGNE